ncbi:hypothetical protein [Siccirubricoccus sp. G192]|uniref:hypothetical protein n=1 Tax=Siccirubricoccus sp. G192 TaxID=2849651 RepID=UPI001C2C813C|nr:hypothetical protein [Siccirubricoccus sp. G192]MBV1798023.1 hypothetical protein [Siccirubricoccus sp. G192]
MAFIPGRQKPWVIPSSRKRIEALDEIQVAVAGTGEGGAHRHLPPLRPGERDFLDRQRLVHLMRDGCLLGVSPQGWG